MKRVAFSSLGAVALIAGLSYVSPRTFLGHIESGSVAVAQTPQKQGPVQVRLQGEKQVKTKDAKGKETITWQSLTGNVKPGDVVRYTVVAENKSDRTIKNLSVNGPIPKGTLFVLQSVQAPNNAQVTYSIDGGKTFVATPTITVKENGTSKPAPAKVYTHIRVKLPVIAAKSTVKATYETQVR